MIAPLPPILRALMPYRYRISFATMAIYSHVSPEHRRSAYLMYHPANARRLDALWTRGTCPESDGRALVSRPYDPLFIIPAAPGLSLETGRQFKASLVTLA